MGYFDNMQKKYDSSDPGNFSDYPDLGKGNASQPSSETYLPKTNDSSGDVNKISQAASLWSPAIGVAGMFLSNLMNQRAAAEAEKKKLAVELALKQGKDVSDSSQQMINVYKDILTRG